MKIWSKQSVTGAGALVVSLMVVNFLNFVFNAFLGRHMSYEEFGTVTFYNTILLLTGIIYSALGGTVNHRTAYLNGKYNHEAGILFTSHVRLWATRIMLVVALLWIFLSPLINKAFHIDDFVSVLLFSPIFVLGIIVGINKGWLQGNLNFVSVALILLVEPFIKLLTAAALVFLDLEHLVYISIPVSLLASFIMAIFLVKKNAGRVTGTNEFRFPKRFFSAAVIAGLSSTAFLSLDIVLVKHFLDPVSAGQYSLLSLVGKMVFFLGSILNSLIITFVSHDAGERRNPHKTFYRLMGAALSLTVIGVLAFGWFGEHTIPLLLGDKVLPILPYLFDYSLAIGMFTLASVVVIYHLAREQYSFSVLALVMTLAMCVGMVFNHNTIGAVVDVIFWSSLASLAAVIILHAINRNGRFIFANIIDLVNLFKPLQQLSPLKNGGKRILIMNWRDTKHTFAGGAEIYIHELAKRWVSDGSQVTWFCGNDGKSSHDETIDGVRIIRRGGFNTVYVWAFIYYLTKFRRRFDIIVDCQNGIPFFTPAYVKEKVYCLMFHVHQEVFFKYLPKPQALLASVLENRAMPYFYRNVKFLTISESTKKDMEDLDIVGNGIEVIFPGVNLSEMQPGQKDQVPTVLYLGRLKAYKSVDVLIRSFVNISKKMASAKLQIAGTGEEDASLRKLVGDLGLSTNVEFLGKVSEHQKIQLMQQAWVFVNPSMMEGWGITTIEANACGTPVVASDVPGLRDSVQNPHSGFLVPHGNSEILGEKILKLLEDGNLRSQMNTNAVKWANQYDWSASASKSIRILKTT